MPLLLLHSKLTQKNLVLLQVLIVLIDYLFGRCLLYFGPCGSALDASRCNLP